jgi:hypothetical protein
VQEKDALAIHPAQSQARTTVWPGPSANQTKLDLRPKELSSKERGVTLKMHWLPLTPANKVKTAEFCNRRGQRGSLRRNIRQAPEIEK